MGGWSEGYTFHGDAKRVFRDFFGTGNPFADFQVTYRGYFEVILVEIGPISMIRIQFRHQNRRF